MLELFGKFNEEARQALFAALSDSLGAGQGAVTLNAMAAGLVRVPSLRLALHAVDLSQLLASLSAPQLGESSLDTLQALLVSPTPGPEGAPPFPGVPMGTLPLDHEARAAFAMLCARFENAADSTVGPKQALAVALESSPRLAALFAQHGITSGMLD